MKDISSFYKLLESPKKIVITMHQKPDGDAMGSSLALYHFFKSIGHDVQVISPTNYADFLRWMPDVKKVLNYETAKEKSESIINRADIIFCLDFNTMSRVKNMESILRSAFCIKVLIDHHQEPDTASFDYGISDTSKSSTCEMVYDFIMASPYKNNLNLDMATCIYTGTMTDTGSFRFPSTTASVHKMIVHFKEMGLNHSIIHQNIYDTNLENKLQFVGNALLNRMTVIYELNTALMSIPKSDIIKYDIKTGDTEGLVNYLTSIQGIKLAAIVIDREGERKWSFRSKDGFDVNDFARKHFNGGGHKAAAGGSSLDTLENTTEHFKTIIKEYESQLSY